MTPIQFRTLRRKHKASIIELATIVGMGQECLSAWEMGLAQLPAETIEMLAQAVQSFQGLRKEWFLRSLEGWIPDTDSSEIE